MNKLKVIPMLRRRLFLALMFGVVALAGSGRDGRAQTTEATDAGATLVSSSWTLQCLPAGTEKDLFCEASQTIAVKETRETVLIAFVTPWQQAGAVDSFVLRFQLPHGLDIPAGVQIKIDGKPMESPVIQTSGQAGVFARTGLTDELLAAMKKGATMTVTFTALNGSELSIPVTLNGFSAIFAKVQ